MTARRWISLSWPAALPLFWLSGWMFLHGPGPLQAVPGLSLHGLRGVPGVQVPGLLGWLVIALVRVSALGLALSLLARALGPVSLRTLLTVRQSCWIGILTAALVWVALTGYIWASVNGDEGGVFFWQVILGAAGDLFLLAWMVLGVRAAASQQPQRTGWMLIGSALLTFYGAIGGLRLLIDLQPDLNLLIVGLWAFLVVGLVLVQPLATAGVAALAMELWPLLLDGQRRGSPPAPKVSPGPGPTAPAAPERSAGPPPAPQAPPSQTPENESPAPEPPTAEEPLPPPNGHHS